MADPVLPVDRDGVVHEEMQPGTTWCNRPSGGMNPYVVGWSACTKCTEQKALQPMRDKVTEIAEKLRDGETEETIAAMAHASFPHWWQRGRRRQWAEGYRLAWVRATSIAWHSMP